MILLWILIPAANFVAWYLIGSNSPPSCIKNTDSYSDLFSLKMRSLLLPTLLPCEENEYGDHNPIESSDTYFNKGVSGYNKCSPVIHSDYEMPNIETVSTEEFDSYRSARLAPMTHLKGRNLEIKIMLQL